MFTKDRSLTAEALDVMRHQATERAYTSPETIAKAGSYLCRACGLALFRTHMQFQSFCGWPSFDEIIENAVCSEVDQDGIRMEIHCARCHAHLGHLFEGEGFTAKNKRYCVNTISLDFAEDTLVLDTEEAIVAGGCFWGVEHYFNLLPGVIKTEVGYIGGATNQPTYAEVCAGTTGHIEAVRVLYDCAKLDYKALIQYFFEIHDPTQVEGQGPDVGAQYQSAIFYHDNQQKQIAQEVIGLLEEKHYAVMTKLQPSGIFWAAETYHQHYYLKNKHVPYCHRYTKRF